MTGWLAAKGSHFGADVAKCTLHCAVKRSSCSMKSVLHSPSVQDSCRENDCSVDWKARRWCTSMSTPRCRGTRTPSGDRKSSSTSVGHPTWRSGAGFEGPWAPSIALWDVLELNTLWDVVVDSFLARCTYAARVP